MNLFFKIIAYLYAFSIFSFLFIPLAIFFDKDKHLFFYRTMKLILLIGTSLFITASSLLIIYTLRTLN